MRIVTLIGLLLAIFGLVFHVAAIAGNMVILFVLSSIILVAIGVLTGK